MMNINILTLRINKFNTELQPITHHCNQCQLRKCRNKGLKLYYIREIDKLQQMISNISLDDLINMPWYTYQ